MHLSGGYKLDSGGLRKLALSLRLRQADVASWDDGRVLETCRRLIQDTSIPARILAIDGPGTEMSHLLSVARKEVPRAVPLVELEPLEETPDSAKLREELSIEPPFECYVGSGEALLTEDLPYACGERYAPARRRGGNAPMRLASGYLLTEADLLRLVRKFAPGVESHAAYEAANAGLEERKVRARVEFCSHGAVGERGWYMLTACNGYLANPTLLVGVTGPAESASHRHIKAELGIGSAFTTILMSR